MENPEVDETEEEATLPQQPGTRITPSRCEYCGGNILNFTGQPGPKMHPVCGQAYRAHKHEPRWCEWCGNEHNWEGAFTRCRRRYERARDAVRAWLREKEAEALAAKRALFDKPKRG